MALTTKQRDHLLSIGAGPLPLIQVGAGGLTKHVLYTIDDALNAHELVRVRVPYGDRDRRGKILREIAPLSGSYLVEKAGNAALLYRPSRTPVITFPEA